MGPELDVKRNIDAVVEVSENKENNIPTQGQDHLLLQCANKGENKIFTKSLSTEPTIILDQHEGVEINIIESTNDCDGGLVESGCQDATENSSSFADTVSGTENNLLDNEEVESQLCDANSLEPFYNQYSKEFQMRQKKLTMHWRKFIRPLMWRCKWTELQIRELKSKALKYDKELLSHNAFHNIEVSDAKSLPIPSQRHRNKILKRMKRKRIEETLDVASYMLRHNLFSYYEKKKFIGASVEDFGDKNSIRNDECGTAEGWSSFNLSDGENSLEHILCTIEVTQSEVRKLKSRVDRVVNENPMKFSSINKLSFQTPSDSPDSPEGENRFRDSSRHISEYLGDILMIEGAVSGRGADIQSQISGSSENAEDDILIHNQAAKDELRDFENIRGQFTDQPQVLPEDRKPVLPKPVNKDDLNSKIVEPVMSPRLQSLSAVKLNFDRNKIRRRRR